MTSNWWTFDNLQQTSQQFLSNGPNSGFTEFFRRPIRVVKPNSRNQSPRNPNRRRMTAQLPTRTRSVIDPSRSNQSSQWLPNRHHPVRPTSWHPISVEPSYAQNLQQPQFFPSEMDQFCFQPTFTTTNIHGLVTPINYPVVDDSHIQGLITPLDELPAQDLDSIYAPSQHFIGQHFSSFKQPTFDFNNSAMAMNTSQMYWTNQYPISANISTAPASPEFLAMPDVGSPFDIALQEPDIQKDELVGMGLYDSPAEVQVSSLLFGGWDGLGQRKSLKLEESFEPKPPSESGNEDDQSQDDAEAESNNEDLFDDAESDPITIMDIPVLDDRIEGYTDSNLFHNLGGHMTSQTMIQPVTHVGWI